MVKKKKVKLTLNHAAIQAYRLYHRKKCFMKVGIDYSYASPSWSVYDGVEYFSYFISQRKREEGLQCVLQSHKDKSLKINICSAMSMIPKDMTYVERNHCLASIVIDTIEHHRKLRKLKQEQVHIVIERYAYGICGMSSISHLHEAGGVLRNYLFRNQYLLVDELSPATIKRVFTTIGNAKKLDMLKYYMQRYGLPDPSLSLQFKEPIDFDDIYLKKVPKPIEDLVDSLAILSVIEPKLLCMGTTINPSLLTLK